MKNIYYSLTIALTLLIIVSCSTESTPIYQLTTSVEPTEAGTVSPTSGEYEEGEQVNITATANEHWVFDSWQGGQTGSTNPATVTMDSDKNITALFVKKEYPLTVNTEGEGTVSEEIVQAKSTDYPHGTNVELTANPADGWVFTQWGENLEGSDNPATITVEDETSVTSVFKSIDDLLSVIVEGEGTVEIAQESANENPSRTQVELTANASEGWEFVEWLGDLDGNENQKTLSIDSEKSVEAVFERVEYTLSTSLEGEGVITISPDQNVYYHGDEVTITIEPADGWSFVYWDGDIEGTENPYSHTLESDISATAFLDESPFAGGNGSELYPYQVSTVEQLQAIREYPDKHYLQINDIDASATLNWNEGKGFNPIGDDDINFTGSYDGDGHIISDLYINREDKRDVGLFGYITQGIIKNVALTNVNISGFVNTGSLVGRNNGGDIINCNSSGLVTSSSDAGGLVAFSSSGNIDNSFADVEVRGSFLNTGGLVGRNWGNVSNSYSLGRVDGAENSTGGLIGYNSGEIEKTFAIGDVSGIDKVGGLIGSNERGNVSNSYAKGSVTGEEGVGGIAGVNSNNGSVIYSYATGNISGTTDVGGLIGTNGATMESSYWNTESSKQTNAVGIGSSNGTTGLTTSEMKGTSAEESMPEFDWDEIWMTVSGDYPILRWQEE